MTRYEECMERINDFEKLERGWFDGEGEKINLQTLKNAKNILSLLRSEEDLSVYPNPVGGVQIEYFNENENRDYEIEVYENWISINSYKATRILD